MDLVTTGGGAGTGNRTTAVLVGELFRNAQQSVLVAGYAVYQGQKVFQAVADRMQASPDLSVLTFDSLGNAICVGNWVGDFSVHRL